MQGTDGEVRENQGAAPHPKRAIGAEHGGANGIILLADQKFDEVQMAASCGCM